MGTLNKLKNLVNIGLPAFILGFGLNYFLNNSNNFPNEELEEKLKVAEHLKKLTNYKPLEKQEIDSAFHYLNPGLREYLDKVYFLEPEDFSEKNVVGDAHDNTICLTKNFSYRALVHEATHIRKNALDNFGLDFSKKWGEIANFEYGEKNYIKYKNKDQVSIKWKEDLTKIPRNGLLTPYSAKSINEDVADFVGIAQDYLQSAFLYEFFSEVNPDFNKKGLKKHAENFPLFFADTTDHRYKQKLDLLKEYNFLTKEEHEKLSENLGSLHYLLEK